MFSKCTRKLMLRWSLLEFVLTEVVFGIYRLLYGRLPASDKIRINAGLVSQLPFHTHRLVDPLVMVVPTALLVWAVLKFDLGALSFGVFFGICGSFIVGLCGFLGLAIYFAICTLVILMAMVALESNGGIRFGDVVVTELPALVTIWLLNTLYQGAVVGFLFAITGLAVVIAASLIYYGIAWLAILAGPLFYRTFLTCRLKEGTPTH